MKLKLEIKMRIQQIQFKGLPFRPEDRQVFYIEEEYDAKVNDFIESHYQDLCAYFHSRGLQFIYLPLFFRTAGIEEKVRYYAPYLSEKLLSVKRVESGVLLRFLADRCQKIEPSLIFSARNSSSDHTTTFLQLPISEVGRDGGFDIQDIIHAVRQCNEEWLSAHIGQPIDDIASQQRAMMPKPQSCEPSIRYCEESSTSARESERMMHYEEAEQYDVYNEPAPKTKKKKGLAERFVDFLGSSISKEEDGVKLSETSEPDFEKEEVQSLINTEEVLRELRESVQKLRLEGISLMAIHEFIDKQEPLSHLVITEDYRIFLPDYNNMEIEMGALPKAIYFLFLRYPEGIVCKHMPDYYNELLGIYKQLRPNTDEARLNLTITKVVNPLGNALNENIARIRKAFVEKFDEHLACHYIITGERGLQYSIPLDRDLITWEE